MFPFNKEINNLLNFSHVLSFKIAHVYDVKEHGKIGTIYRGLVSQEEFTVENITDICWEDIDMLIIGHVSQLSHVYLSNIKLYLLKKCLHNSINVYTFDNEEIPKFINMFYRKQLLLICPDITPPVCKNNGKLYTISTPVLGIFGTSSQQGKFTLQLQLRQYFLKNSFSVGQLGTEPSSLLYEMDEVFPYGYASHLELDHLEIIKVVNQYIHNIDIKEKDIIIVGGQSGSIPVYSYNLKYLNTHTLNFLIGANPDAIILCVNLFDSMDYISRTMAAISNLVECHIIAIAVAPFVLRKEWRNLSGGRIQATEDEITSFKKQIYERFHLNCYVIGTDEIQDLYDECLCFFSEP